MSTIFWDFDGTLVYAAHLWSGTIGRALEKFGCTVPAEAIHTHLHTGFTWHTPEVEYPHRLTDWWPDMFAHFTKLYTQQGIDSALHNPLNKEIRKQIINPENYRLYEDAAPVLEACQRAGHQSYILSNNYPELPQVLAGLGLDQYFAGCVVSAQLGYEKPHPAIFRAALSLAGNPQKVYMVGDNPHADILGGNAAGMITVLVNNGRESEAAYTCATLTEVLQIIK